MTQGATAEEIKRAEAYGNSRLIDVWKISDHPEVKSVVDYLYTEMDAAGLPSKRFQKKWRDTLRVVVLDLFVAYKTDPEMYISFARSSNAYNQKSRYSSLFLGARIAVPVADFLINNGYAEQVIGHYYRDGSKRKSHQSRLRATDKLINLAEEDHNIAAPMIRRDEDEEVIILRDENKQDMEYAYTAETNQMRENLKLINRNLENHAILLYIWDEDLKQLNDHMKKHIDPKKRGTVDFTRKRLKECLTMVHSNRVADSTVAGG